MIPLFTLSSIYSTNAASVSRFSLSIGDIVELRLKHTHLIRTPSYSRQFALSWRKKALTFPEIQPA